MVARHKYDGDSDSVTELVFHSALYRTHYPDEKTLARYQLIFIGPRACDVLVLCVSGCRARMRGAPCHGR